MTDIVETWSEKFNWWRLTINWFTYINIFCQYICREYNPAQKRTVRCVYCVLHQGKRLKQTKETWNIHSNFKHITQSMIWDIRRVIKTAVVTIIRYKYIYKLYEKLNKCTLRKSFDFEKNGFHRKKIVRIK